MFRTLFRRPRTIRVPVDNGGVKVQEVKLVRSAAAKSSNFITTFLVAYFVYRFLESHDVFGLEQKDKNVREDVGNLKKEQQNNKPGTNNSEHWRRQHAELNAGKFGSNPGIDSNIRLTSDVVQITVPVWIRARPQPLYKPSDPEFKEYIKLQSDKKRIDELKRTVGKWAGARLQNPAHEMNLKAIGFNGNIGLTLDVVPQLHPPPLYEVPCIGYDDGKILVGWRRLSPQLGAQIDHVFRPGVTFNATKAALTTFFSVSYALTSAKLSGLLPGKPTSQISTPPFPDPTKGAPTIAKSVLSAKDIAKDNAIPSAANWPSDKQAVKELLRVVHNGKAALQRHQDLVQAVPYSTAVQLAAATFKRTQVIGHAAVKQLNTRGAVQIRGIISCFGDRGVYRMEVVAFYQPGEDTFLGPIVVRGAYILMDFDKWGKAMKSRPTLPLRPGSGKDGLSPSSKPGSVPPTSDEEKP